MALTAWNGPSDERKTTNLEVVRVGMGKERMVWDAIAIVSGEDDLQLFGQLPDGENKWQTSVKVLFSVEYSLKKRSDRRARTNPELQFYGLEEERLLETRRLVDEETSKLPSVVVDLLGQGLVLETVGQVSVGDLQPDGVRGMTGTEGEHPPVEVATGEREPEEVRDGQLEYQRVRKNNKWFTFSQILFRM